ncbi:unnamed protein product [Gemmataceae bacterium]|nr:unnamed protein product [Gemmataceae bacterium]VTT98142.1 unnamed protein product [Gemmataceae bacterium]
MPRTFASLLLSVLFLGGHTPSHAQDEASVTIPGVDRKIPSDTKELDLSRTKVTDAGLKELRAALPRCDISDK